MVGEQFNEDALAQNDAYAPQPQPQQQQQEGFGFNPSMDSGAGEEAEAQSYPTLGIIRDLNPTKDIEQFEHYLKGEVYDKTRHKWSSSPDGKPFTLNNKGVSYVVGVLKLANQTMRTSTFNEGEIDGIMKYIVRQYIPTLMLNQKEYGMTNSSTMPTLLMAINLQMYSVLKKAHRGGDRNLIRGIVNERITGSYGGEQPRKRGFLFWKR